MMDDDCPAVSCIAPLVSSSYSTKPESAITAKHVLMNETAPSLWSFEEYPSTPPDVISARARATGGEVMNIIKSSLAPQF